MSGSRTFRPVLVAAAAGLVALWGCGDLLQEPESGIFPLPLELVEVSGDGQVGAPGAPLAQPLRVRTLHETEPVGRLWVKWTVISGGGTVEPRNSFSDANGIAEARWTLGSAGAQRVRATMRNGVPVEFEATAGGQ
jgi:hypothetical protein